MSSIDRSLLAPVGVVGVVGIVSSNSLEDILVTVREAAAATRSLCSMLPRGREKNDDSAERERRSCYQWPIEGSSSSFFDTGWVNRIQDQNAADCR